MQLVERREFDEAYALLKKAEVLTDDGGCLANDDGRRLRLSAVTFNNMGCFFKRRSKLHAALQYLFRALEVELRTESAENPAATHLNICATFSQMGRHEEAHEHAEKAIMQLQADWDNSDNPTEEHPTNKSFLAMAYHNLAVEQEFLHYWEEARRSYGHAYNLAEQAWGANSPMTTALHKSLLGFQRKKRMAEKKEAEAALRELSSRTARAGVSGRGGGQGQGRGQGLAPSRPRSAVAGRQGMHLARAVEPPRGREDAQQYVAQQRQRPSSAPLRRAPMTERSDNVGRERREIYTRVDPEAEAEAAQRRCASYVLQRLFSHPPTSFILPARDLSFILTHPRGRLYLYCVLRYAHLKHPPPHSTTRTSTFQGKHESSRWKRRANTAPGGCASSPVGSPTQQPPQQQSLRPRPVRAHEETKDCSEGFLHRSKCALGAYIRSVQIV